MSFRAIRTDRYKYIHWVNRARNGELDELYDLQKDPYELINLAKKPAYAAVRKKMTRDLRALAADALGL
jgi:arylsulfatase A-like enzyme